MMIRARWYQPDAHSLSYRIVARVFELRLWRAEFVLYWHYR